jgi:NADPH2:quinone reductase
MEAVARTGATIAFDAIGGGRMASTILSSMERMLTAHSGEYNRYGSSVGKHVYIYGMLDPGPTLLDRKFGMAWGVDGWLMTWFMKRIGPDRAAALRERVARELQSTFATRTTAEISLAQAVSIPVIESYTRHATGEKYVINPSLASTDPAQSAEPKSPEFAAIKRKLP